MPKNDYFKIVYMILTVLYKYKKDNKILDLNEIAPETLKIDEAYRNEILEDLLDAGYIKGFKIKNYICGKVLDNLEDIKITMQGIEYLQDNSKMKKVGEILKEVKDWVAFIKP